MALETILFDLDDTLVAEEASAEASLLETCALAQERYGIVPRELLRSVRRRARQLWHASSTFSYCEAIGISSWEGLWARFLGHDPNLRALRRWAPTYRREAWARALAEHRIDDSSLAAELATTFPRKRRRLHLVFPETKEVLRELRNAYRLALVTNAAPDLQRHKIRGAKIGGYFETVAISGELGVGKPNPRIFLLTLGRLGISPQMAVAVGDSIRRDVAGAQRAGLKAIWINRDGTKPEEGIRPDAQISNLNELPGSLREVAT